MSEVLRDSVPVRAADKPEKAGSDERMPLFWRVFGGTILSIAALAAITVCQYFNSVLGGLRGDMGRLNDEIRKEMTHLDSDLRKDLGRLNEAQGTVVKLQDFNSRLKSVWDSIKELQTLSAAVSALKERDMLREQHLREENERKELVRELQLLRERLATLEGKQAAKGAQVNTAANQED
jgi:hypothetical protein